MQILLIAGVTLLTAGAPDQGQQPALVAIPPVTVTFLQPSFEDAMSSLAQMSGVLIEIDQTVTSDVRRQPVAESPITMRAVTLEQAVEVLTRLKGLSYSMVDAKTVRIFKKG
jgi:hypothetical protein